MKKYLIFFLPFLLSACAGIRWVTIDKGHIVDTNGKSVQIIGSPQMICINAAHQIIADGLFVYQRSDGSFVIDEYGTRYVVVNNPYCRLGRGE